MSMARPMQVLVALVGLGALAPVRAQLVTGQWVVGGQGGDTWSAASERLIALDDTTEVGHVRNQRIERGLNVLTRRVRESASVPSNVLGYQYSFGRSPFLFSVDRLVVDWNPRLWQGGSATAGGDRALVDGDDLTPTFTLNPPGGGRPSADTWITIDIGVPLPIDSVSFQPPQIGFTSAGERLSALAPEAYEVSRQLEPVDWLLFEDETSATGSSGYHALESIEAATVSNSESIIGEAMPLEFTRFLRFKFGGVLTKGVLSEIKAFGAGYAQEGRYLSAVKTFAEPVSLGRITYGFTRYRETTAGDAIEDANAPVTLTIRTRAGVTDDPHNYYIYDELGRLTQVAKAEYESANTVLRASDDNLPQSKAAITDNVGEWNAWSAAYGSSGEEIRSSDGRRNLQFQYQITTSDPFAFGVLDSIAFEVSPLLADSVLAEVSILGEPSPESNLVQVDPGLDTVFVYDLRLVIGSQRPGVDGFVLDVPTGARLLDLEIDGGIAVADADYTLDVSQPRQFGIYFPERLTSDTSIRLTYRAAVYSSSVFLGGQVVNLDPDAMTLPQSIESGDAVPEVTTNSIQIVSSRQRLQALGELSVTPPVITPNGDGANDRAAIEFAVFGVENVDVRAEVLDLQGRQVALLEQGEVTAGQVRLWWEGLGPDNRPVPPGIYLVRVELDVDSETAVRVRPVSVAY